MRKLNIKELRKRKAYLAKISKPIKTIKEIKKESKEITEQILTKIKKLETQRQRNKATEILRNNLELLNNINTKNKDKIYDIFKKMNREIK